MHSVKVACTLAALLFSMAGPLNAQEERRSHLSSDPQVNEARVLIDEEDFSGALDILRPLAPTNPRNPDEVDVLFLLGLSAVGAAQLPEITAEERKAYLNEAIAAFHGILVARPDLVRVRLELARAFYLKGDDALARQQFERVLAGDPHPAIAANIRRFLAVIRQRRRWSGYFGVTLAPDTNINAASDEDTIYIDVYGTRLPFTRDEDSGSRSGLGLSLWGGGEYEHPLRNNLRLRLGGSASRREYEGEEFDQQFLQGYAGPRWLISNRTEISLLGSARRWWSGGEAYSRAVGARLEASHLVNRRVLLRGQFAYHKHKYLEDVQLDGPRSDLYVSGIWQATPTLRFDANVSLNRAHPEQERSRNVGRGVGLGASLDLPRGFTVGVNGELGWTNYKGTHPPFTPVGESRKDKTRSVSFSIYNRGFTLKGFSPKLVVTREMRESNAQLHDYRRTRAEIQFVRQL